MNTSQPDDAFQEILNSGIASVRCGNCGADTIMNSAYAQHVNGPLLSCRHCRNPGPTRT